MCERPPPGPRGASGLRTVTVLVPENRVESLQDLARVLRGRQREPAAGDPFGWRRISTSAELVVDPSPARGARSVTRGRRVPSVTAGR
jgi:hypothetical protein